MAGIESPLGKQTFATSGSRKVFSVEDEDQKETFGRPAMNSASENFSRAQLEEMSQAEFQQMRADRADAIKSQKKISSESKGRIEALVGIGRMTTDVTIGDYKFTLQSLKAKEERETSKNIIGLNGVEQFHEIRTQTIARALIKINDISSDIVLGTKNIEDVVAFVWDLEDIVVKELYSRYAKMVQETSEKLFSSKVLEELKK